VGEPLIAGLVRGWGGGVMHYTGIPNLLVEGVGAAW